MTTWFEKTGYSADIEAFKKLVPDAQDGHAFFKKKGHWANGEKFVSVVEGVRKLTTTMTTTTQ